MIPEFNIYNTLTRKKEKFIPIHQDHVGIYVCGPTVYGDAHLGHARPAITYDVLVRYFKHIGYKVRYVRNITDVGHLENDQDSGDDKIEKRAKLEKIEPMEVVQHYTLRYHDSMRLLNTLPPNIEPRASGHIIEQIELVKKILNKGFAYESNGSVYFDVETYNKQYKYGLLSGRELDDLKSNSRNLDGTSDKKSPFDFALWKRASETHIMRWPSPWSEGFPGWHLECSAMSRKYLGDKFDIHGGGMDLLFPHHECELAQNSAVDGNGGVSYWMHNNLITINGQKMGKSLGNFITLEELFTGSHPLLSQAFSPMTIRFFILQAHYRGTLDFSNEAMIAAEKGLKRLLQAANDSRKLEISDCEHNAEIIKIENEINRALSDDLNTPIAIAQLFEAVKIVNSIKDKSLINQEDKIKLIEIFEKFLFEILGVKDESNSASNTDTLGGVIELLIELRNEAKRAKDYQKSDNLRDKLLKLGVTLKDTKDGTEWSMN